jgi:outer membrane protein OmpA-like peptidoglycan-associated protein
MKELKNFINFIKLNNTRYILILVILFLYNNSYAQTKSYSVTLAPFSSLTNDEFSPVYYENGIVFCSNLKNNSLITYQSEQKKFINIYFVKTKDSIHWKNVKMLAKELTTNYNDGPVTFNEKGNIIYYCRNNDIKKQIRDFSDTTNKLGIYSAELINGIWINIRSFTYNNPLYSFITPALSADGKRLYFASDMPGGYGGTDLYYCDWNTNNWDKPVNLGPAINTPKNESYPFACKSGKLFFASDGHIGFGKKDLYYSQEIDGRWINPIHIDAEINSPDDDFGLVTDENFENGFFSSNRQKTDDIFSFTADLVQFTHCDSMQKNNYCFLFYDERQNDTDTIPVKYEWDFGNGIKKTGLKVKYCFPGPGKYEVTLNIIDSLRGDSILGQTSYKFELKEINQVYINSPDADIADKAILFDGLKTNLPDFKISDYLWDFGEGFKIRGPAITKVFDKKGEYTVQLGLLGEKDSLGNSSKACAYKKIKIFDDYQELAMHTAKEIGEPDEFYTPERQKKSGSDNVESVKEKKDSTIGKKANPLLVRTYLLDDLSELQKAKISENLYQTRECAIEMNDAGIDPASYPVLIKFVKVLKENPDIKLEIAVHTDDRGLSWNNLEITEKWSRDFYSYFLDNGITGEIIHCKGYGELRPIIAKNIKEDSNLNKRVEFIFMNNPK